jgi:hypothetical protein
MESFNLLHQFQIIGLLGELLFEFVDTLAKLPQFKFA